MEAGEGMRSSITAFLAQRGVDIVGFAAADELDEWQGHFSRRIDNGLFPRDYPDRLCSDPRQLLPEARSVIVFGVKYHGLSDVKDPGRGSVAGLMWVRRDAFDMVDLLVDFLEASGARAVDGSLLPAKAVAVKAGIAVQRKNSIAYFDGHGSAARLGVVITDLELPAGKSARAKTCGKCTLCLEACPTGALVEDYVVDVTRCLTFLTEEDRGFPEELRPGLGNRLVGCEMCQLVCPHNKDVPRISFEDLQWLELPALAREATKDAKALNAHFLKDLGFYINSPHAPSRAIAIGLGNWGEPETTPLLQDLAISPLPEVADAARWALGRVRAVND
jgi:epoxyqueuosine reductase